MTRSLWLETEGTIVRISDISAVSRGTDRIYAWLRNKEPIVLMREPSNMHELDKHELDKQFNRIKNLLLEP